MQLNCKPAINPLLLTYNAKVAACPAALAKAEAPG
jgi:hypothetical protein